MCFPKTKESVNSFDTPDILTRVLRTFLSPYFTRSVTQLASALPVTKNRNMHETHVWGAPHVSFFAREKLTFGAYRIQLTQKNSHHQQ